MYHGVIHKGTVGGVTLVALSGELDIAVAHEVGAALTSAAKALLPDVAIDFRQVEFIDASVMGVLSGAYRRITAAGGCLRVIGLQQGPRRVLAICQLDGVMCFHDSVTAATKATCTRHSRP